MRATKEFLETLPYIEVEKPGRIYLAHDLMAYDENGETCVRHEAPCNHEWRVFHGITGDHAKCLRCAAPGVIKIEER